SLRRQPGTRALTATWTGLNQRFLEAAVHRVDQHPGATVAHAERPAGRGDRSFAAYRLEQVRLARAHGDFIAAVELELELEAGHRPRFPSTTAAGWSRRTAPG